MKSRDRGAQRHKSGLTAKLAEVGLWLVALACLSGWVATSVAAKAAQRDADEIEVRSPALDPKTRTGQLLGRLEIEQIGLSVPIFENYDSATLVRGVGHVPGTAVPGGLGNLVLAGHRDTFFRPLRKVRAGMKIEVIAPGGCWSYVVDGTEVVLPSQVDVLDIGQVPGMTLITCFPFEFIGSAPRRFIVHAHLVSADAT